MKAIIMAAGRGSRLLNINKGRPKCLISMGKETLIGRMVKLLHQRNIDDITVITGYKSHLIHQELKEKVTYFHNPFYEVTNSIASLWLAKEKLTDDVLLMNADLYLEINILDIALSQTKDVVMLSDSTRIETADFRFGVDGEVIRKTGNQLSNDETDCEYVGVVRIDQNFIAQFKARLEVMISKEDFNNWWEGVLYSFIEEGVNIFHKDIRGNFWTEVDDLRDYRRLFSWLEMNDLHHNKNEEMQDLTIQPQYEVAIFNNTPMT